MYYWIFLGMALLLSSCEQEDSETREQRSLENLNVKTKQMQETVKELRSEIDAQSDKQVEKIEKRVKEGNTWEAPPFPSND